MANTIQATFGLDLGPLRIAARQAAAIGRQLGSAFTRLVNAPLARLGAAFAAIGGTAYFAKGIVDAYALGDALGEMSARTGASVKSLFILQQQLKDNGVAAEDLGQLFNKMQKAFGSKEGRQALGDLGLRFKDLQKLAPADEFVAIGKAINQIGGPARKAQAAIAIFGKSGGRMLAVFSDPEFGKGSANLQHQAQLLQRNAEVFGNISDRLSRVGNVMRGFFLGVAERIAGSLLPILTKLETVDLIGIGQKFGAALIEASAAFVGAFADPSALMTLVGSGLKLGIAAAVQYMMAQFNFATKTLADWLIKAWDVLKPVGQMMAGWAATFAGDLLVGIGTIGESLYAGLQFAFQKGLELFDNGMRAIISNVGAGLAAAIGIALEQLGKIPLIGKKLGLDGFKAGNLFAPVKTALEASMGSGFKSKSMEQLKGEAKGSSGIGTVGHALQGIGAGLSAAADANFAKVGPQLAKVLDKSMNAMAALFKGDTSTWKNDFANALSAMEKAGKTVLANPFGGANRHSDPVTGFEWAAGLKTASAGGVLGNSGGLTSGGLTSGGLGGSGLGTAYGLIRRGDAERRKNDVKKSPEVDAIDQMKTSMEHRMDDYWGPKSS